MNLLFLNVLGLGKEGKIAWVKTFCSKHQISFLTLLEFKMRRIYIDVVRLG